MNVVSGGITGSVLALDEPLSLWGGVSPTTGEIIEPGHPQSGEHIGGVILGLPHGRGSSSASSVLAELLRNGSGPLGIILEEPDSILVVGTLVARLLYGVECPIVLGEIPATGTRVTLIDGNIVALGSSF